MEYLYVGKIVNTHGIKGEVRILSEFRYKDKVFVQGFPIYVGKDKILEIVRSYRVHKIFDMITMEGYSNINEVLKYKGQAVYVRRDDLKLDRDEFLDEDLIGLDVIVNQQIVGKVKRIIRGVQDLLVVERDGQEYKVPYVSGLVKEIQLEKGITLEDVKGLLGD